MNPHRKQFTIKKVFTDALETFNPIPKDAMYDITWESIEFPIGQEKPPKDQFEAKFQELLNVQFLKELRDKRNTLLEKTDRYATTDYPHTNLTVQQQCYDQRQTLRDLPSLVTPLEDGSVSLWVTNQNGTLQKGDSLISSNISGYFTKGEPTIMTIKDACDFTSSTTETYYSNIKHFTQINESIYYTSNSISKYEGQDVSHYSNVVIYDGINVNTDITTGEYSNLDSNIQSNYTAVLRSNISPIKIEGYTPVLTYYTIPSNEYDANVHTDYIKIVEPASNNVIYSNISANAYEALDSNLIVTPGYTSFFHETSKTSIRVGEYKTLTPDQRTEYTVQSVPAVTSNLQSFYTPQTNTNVHELRYLDGSGVLTDQANAVWTARQVECTFPDP